MRVTLKGIQYEEAPILEGVASFGYIYITENLINGKCYIGQHKSESFDESYKGSGMVVRRAFNKYGFDNFKVTPIEWCQSREELNEREKYWISYYDAVNSPDFYNIASGGEGGNTLSGMSDERRLEVAQHSREATEKLWESVVYREKVTSGQKRYWKSYDPEEVSSRMRDAWTRRDHTKQSERMIGEKNPNYGVHRPHTEETKSKISQSLIGEKNPMYGKRSPCRKRVLCIELNRVFESLCDAAEFINIDPSYFSKIVRESIGLGSVEFRGYHWKYAEEVG